MNMNMNMGMGMGMGIGIGCVTLGSLIVPVYAVALMYQLIYCIDYTFLTASQIFSMEGECGSNKSNASLN
jgi:hypothetical protein